MQPVGATLLWGWRLAFAFTLAAVLWLALAPAKDLQPDWFDNADKLRHAGAFAVLWCLGAQARVGPRWLLAALLMAFGAGIEVAQSFTPSHEPSWLDGLADALGLALGFWASRHLSPLRSAAQP